MTKQYNVAVVGATGAVGETILSILAQRHFPIDRLYALASERSAGDTLMYKDKPIIVENLATFDFSQVQLALFSAGAAVSARYVPEATANGCVVIDNTSQYRYQPDVPLVVPEVNPECIEDFRDSYIIANPNCSTIQMVVALKPIYDVAGISRINVATYQAVSGSGRRGITELVSQSGELLNGRPVTPQAFSKQIAFNVIPHIDIFMDNGYTKEEMKMVWETRKLLHDDNIEVNPTAVRVPVFYGHSEAVHLELKQALTADQAREILQQAPGVVVMDQHKDGAYPTAVGDAGGEDAVYVGRIREDISHPCGLNLWIVADNVRKGAALNAVQIAEVLIQDYL